MFFYELSRKEVPGEAYFPLQGYQAKLSLGLDFGLIDVPLKARRRIAAQLLRDLAANLDEDELVAQTNGSLEPGHRPDGHLTADAQSALRRAEGWVQPNGMDLRIIKSAHRVILEVAEKGVSGRVVLASELVGTVGLSAPTIGRLLREGEAANDYLKQYIIVTPTGRTKALDLTPAGRLLASKIRAGSLPV